MESITYSCCKRCCPLLLVSYTVTSSEAKNVRGCCHRKRTRPLNVSTKRENKILFSVQQECAQHISKQFVHGINEDLVCKIASDGVGNDPFTNTWIQNQSGWTDLPSSVHNVTTGHMFLRKHLIKDTVWSVQQQNKDVCKQWTVWVVSLENLLKVIVSKRIEILF